MVFNRSFPKIATESLMLPQNSTTGGTAISCPLILLDYRCFPHLAYRCLLQESQMQNEEDLRSLLKNFASSASKELFLPLGCIEELNLQEKCLTLSHGERVHYLYLLILVAPALSATRSTSSDQESYLMGACCFPAILKMQKTTLVLQESAMLPPAESYLHQYNLQKGAPLLSLMLSYLGEGKAKSKEQVSFDQDKRWFLFRL